MMERIVLILFLTELALTILACMIAFIRFVVCHKKQQCQNNACPILYYCNHTSHIVRKKEELRKLKEELQKYVNAHPTPME